MNRHEMLEIFKDVSHLGNTWNIHLETPSGHINTVDILARSTAERTYVPHRASSMRKDSRGYKAGILALVGRKSSHIKVGFH